jgi:phosphoribosylanthranilate isomerase
MTWVKICGATNFEDALLAVDSGADAVGFVLAPSKRQVTADTVASMVRRLPSCVEKIGVFLNETPERVVEIVRQTGLTGVQLHGMEMPWCARHIAATASVKVFKGIHAGPTFASDLAAWSREREVSALLLDSGNGQQGGGTGKIFYWNAVYAALQPIKDEFKLILAGGLTSGNVADAIAKFRPWGVDVVSGVESEPGRKDPQKVKEFIAAVRGLQK